MAAKKTGNRDKVEGVLVAKAKREVVDKFLAQLGVAVAPDASLEVRVQALARHLKKATPDKHLADCDNCKGDSDVRLDVCPYCGEGDDQAAAKAAEQPAAKAPAPQKGKKKTTTRAAAAAAKAPAALAKAPATEVVAAGKGTEGDLDKHVARVQALRATGAVCAWELGTEVARIYDGRLHMLRKTKDGHTRYKNWSQFCQVELQMTPQQSYKLMDVAKLFTRADVQQVGTTKLAVMVQLPEKERKRLLEKARKGMPRSEVAREVRELAASRPVRDTGRSGRAAAATEKARAERRKRGREKELTVSVQLGRVTVPLYQRPKKKGADPKRATSLAQDPHGQEAAFNGVVVSYRLVKQAKGLALVVERRREGADK